VFRTIRVAAVLVVVGLLSRVVIRVFLVLQLALDDRDVCD